MLKQEYLRPHDVTVFLQLALRPRTPFRELAVLVGLSVGEAHNATRRLEMSRLVLAGDRSVNLTAALEFLVHGVPYAFPAQLGPDSRGVPTGFSAPPLAAQLVSDQQVVWPDHRGESRGITLVPLSAAAPRISRENQDLYGLLTLVDAIRVGKARERNLAREYLQREFNMLKSTWPR